MRICDELRTTTNSAVFKKLYKQKVSPGCYTKWHGYQSDHDPWRAYYALLPKQSDDKKVVRWVTRARHPNWKLVSKNKHQWMKKKLFIYKEWSSALHAHYNFMPIRWDIPGGRYKRCW